MADIFGIGTTLGALGDTTIGALNFGLQKEAYEYQKQQQEYANKWNEYVYEDQKKQANTAVQRYVKDLEAAGMNKLLAAGGSAGTGSATSASTVGVTPPQMQANLTEKIGSIYDSVYKMVTMGNEIATSQAQRQLMSSQALQSIESSNLTKAQKKAIMYDLEKSMNMNIRTTDNLNSNFNSLMSIIGRATAKTEEEIKEYERRQEQKKEANQSWSNDKEKVHTSEYVRDPNMPSW